MIMSFAQLAYRGNILDFSIGICKEYVSKGIQMSNKPDILVIMTDMQRADTIRALGNEAIRTPNLDRLAAEGTAFTNCFSPSPVCVPARCCMHYGRYPQRTGLFDNGRMMDDNGASFPAVLGQAGYQTHAVGKCHFTPDSHALRGFQSRQTQEECTSDPGGDDYIAWLRDQGLDYYEPHGARGEMYYIPQISTLPAEAHPSQWVGNESIRFIKEAPGHNAPWLLFSSFIHPHPPLSPPKPWHKLYRAPDMPLPFIPENSASLLTWVNRHQNRYKYRDRGLDMNLLRCIKAYYYATISFVDFQIGRIIQVLEENGRLDKTLILFTSDHGEHLGDLGCFGKRSMHDPSVRVPMLVRYPDRFPAGGRCTTATSLCDVFPTLLGAATGERDDGLDLDGVDLHRTVTSPDPQRIVFSQYSSGPSGIYMAASEQWKYVYSAGDRQEFLFNRMTDPHETDNLAGGKSASDAGMLLRGTLLKHLQNTGRNEAVETQNDKLCWHCYPLKDESYLANPDANLLIQDYPAYPTCLPGYNEETKRFRRSIASRISSMPVA